MAPIQVCAFWTCRKVSSAPHCRELLPQLDADVIKADSREGDSSLSIGLGRDRMTSITMTFCCCKRSLACMTALQNSLLIEPTWRDGKATTGGTVSQGGYATADDYIGLAVISDATCASIGDVIEQTAWHSDPRMRAAVNRLTVADAIQAAVVKALRSRPTTHWMSGFAAGDRASDERDLALGKHTLDILRELHYDGAGIAELSRSGVIGTVSIPP